MAVINWAAVSRVTARSLFDLDHVFRIWLQNGVDNALSCFAPNLRSTESVNADFITACRHFPEIVRAHAVRPDALNNPLTLQEAHFNSRYHSSARITEHS